MRIKNIENLIKYKQDEIILKIKSCQKVPGTFWQLSLTKQNFIQKKKDFLNPRCIYIIVALYLIKKNTNFFR